MLEKQGYLPFNKSNLDEGVFIFWKLKNRASGYREPEWHSGSFYNSKENREFINKLKWEDRVDSYLGYIDGFGEVNYLIINSNGEVLSNNFKSNMFFDENKFLHIESEDLKLNQILKIYESKQFPNHYFYFNGKNFGELNKKIMSAVNNKQIEKPKSFNSKTGLKEKPIYEVEKEIEH